jgi:hypothetical protein
MLLPLTILVFALIAAALTAYGADPAWMTHSRGLDVIMLSRRLELPMLGLALIGCAVVLAFVISGRWRVWWLIGLMPILALFAHRFVTDPARAWQVDADARFVPAEQATFVRDADWVVGLSFDGEDYAYPYNVLYDAPVVAQAIPKRRMVLFWSPFANRAVAAETDWTFKPRELEVVSMPANALLVYNARIGQFINGLTGVTPAGQHFTGWLSTLATSKMTFGQWKQLHPATKVLIPPDGWRIGAPAAPIAPRYPIPNAPARTEAVEQVALIGTSRPTAVRESDVSSAPLNMLAGQEPLLMFRDSTGSLRAFARQANGDLTPRFYPISMPGHPSIAFTERDSKSSWATDGRAVDGPLKGEKLKPFDVDDRVYLNVIRFWYPDLVVLTPTPADVGQPPMAAPTARNRNSRRKTPRQKKAAVQVTASF